MTEQILKLQKKMKNELDHDRYEHTIGVMHTAACLAMRYEEDMDRALLAGLLHDCAKCIPAEEKIKMCKKNHIEIAEAEKDNPGLLHAKLGAFLAKEKYGITDESILRAIRFHTTGCPEMTLLDKIIYIADYIEAGRKPLPNLAEVRKLAFCDLDACLYRILEDSLVYLKSKGSVVDPMTEKTYLYYKSIKKELA
ncbi:MAG: bis(5'-nucleosyl)-tetraphosphatase (symmetrical) YqeK [bacterium]|nr:bis(5'-nucleosyl)-tetraphosphatase (symmetrical) YqeK [bacterium]